MTDIVERLRWFADTDMPLEALGVVFEAADEIDRLRRAGFGGLSYDIAEKQRQEIARQDEEIERLRERVAELEQRPTDEEIAEAAREALTGREGNKGEA